MSMDELKKYFLNPLSLLSLFQGVFIWLFMMLFLSLEAAWISFACGGLIGLFLWLTALGYQNKQVAKLTLIGILLNAILSSISAYFAFN
jgi:ABC-type Fe3+-siderophore transport system permease subunit